MRGQGCWSRSGRGQGPGSRAEEGSRYSPRSGSRLGSGEGQGQGGQGRGSWLRGLGVGVRGQSGLVGGGLR